MTGNVFDGLRRYVLGIGCERGTPQDEVTELASAALAAAGISPGELAGVASIDTRGNEPAILGLARDLGAPLLFFSALRLEEETPRLKNPSTIVFARVGCHGVAESAALAAIGPHAALVVPKIKSQRATASIACALLQKD
ncbi:precorrin methylase [Rhizobium sp. R72]|uniref:cobalamin biosynthesis protein n=1 Tax=unclassified Rhizobium TaxID=2613769 RepID=UPI000B5337BA|nr:MULTISPECIES: cobalamin biosynthesis protein [unclassified Rhizobium]OWV86948.1 precorrin methylase [Rhizobium sp. R693]OWV95574.1 precorrin methylase [Rhizobium sp. R72]OWV95874.1 precorrin methylase [Rhizobium sp. R711]